MVITLVQGIKLTGSMKGIFFKMGYGRHIIYAGKTIRSFFFEVNCSKLVYMYVILNLSSHIMFGVDFGKELVSFISSKLYMTPLFALIVDMPLYNCKICVSKYRIKTSYIYLHLREEHPII